MATIKRGEGPIPRGRFGAEGGQIWETPELRAFVAEIEARPLRPGEWLSVCLSNETKARLAYKDPDLAMYMALLREYKGRYRVQARTDRATKRYEVYVSSPDNDNKKDVDNSG